MGSGVLSLSSSATLRSQNTVSTDGTGRLIFSAKQAATTLTGGKVGYTNNSDNGSDLVIGSTQEQVAANSQVSHHLLEETTTTDANQFKASGYLDTGKLSQAVSIYGNAAGTTGSVLTVPTGAQISGNNYEHWNPNQGSISFWVKPSWNGNDSLDHFFYSRYYYPFDIQVFKSTTNNLTVYFTYSGGTSRIMSSSISSWTSGNWYHVFIRWDTDNVISGSNYAELYIGGVLATQYTSSWTVPNGFPIGNKPGCIGCRAYDSSGIWKGDNQAQGLIDDFAIWDRVLTTTEITAIYNSGTGAEAGSYADPNLKFYAKMDGSGTLSPVTYNLGASASKLTAKSTELTGGVNLLTNGSLETASGGSPTSWTVETGATVADAEAANILADTRSQKITYDNGGGGGGIYQTIGVTENTNYSLSGWLKSDGTNGVGFYVYDLTHSSYIVTRTTSGASTTSTTWTNIFYAFEIPAGCTSIAIGLRPNNAAVYSFYVDNVTVVPNLVDNGGMETAGAGGADVFAGWTESAASGSVADETTLTHSGGHALKLTNGGGDDSPALYQNISVTAANWYLLSFWAAGDGTNAGRYKVYDQTNSADIIAKTSTGVTASSYSKVTVIFKAPSGCSLARVWLLSSIGGGRISYFDDVSVIALDNVSTSFQSWAPASDATSASNDLSIHGDSDGVTSSASGARNKAYTFDGSTGYLRQKTYDMNVGTLSYADSNTDISDTGQEFEDWDNDDGGSAEYMVVVTNSDNTTSWGYFCANDGGTQTAVYTKKACTGGSEGFNGTSPSGKTPVGYEIRKTDFQITGNLTVGAWVNHVPFSGRNIIGKKYENSNFLSFYLGHGGTNQFSFNGSNNGTSHSNFAISGATGRSAYTWYFVVGVINGSTATLYVNGVSDGTASGVTTMTDTYGSFMLGAGYYSGFHQGPIDSPFVISSALTQAQIQDIYNSTASHYGLTTTLSSVNTATAAGSLTNDANYHTYTITSQTTLNSLSQDGTVATTSATTLPTGNQYVRLTNSNTSTALTVDWIASAKQATTTPTVGTTGPETRGGDPVAYWKFDDGTGTSAQDSSPNNNDGTITGAAWQTEDMCVAGKCLKFNGSSDNVSVANTISGVQTVEFWVKPNTATNSLINLNWANTITATSSAITANGFSSPTIYVNGKTGSTLTTNSWNHVAVTTATPINASNITIARVGAGYTTGFLDDIKIYDYARTAAQIKADYNARGTQKGASVTQGGPSASSGRSALSDGLIGYWKMDEATWSGTLSEVVDSSGNSNHGQAQGATGGKAYPSSGKFGNGGYFDGVDDYTTLTNSLTTGTSTTVSFWVNTGSATGGRGAFVNTVTSGYNGSFFGFYQQYTPTLYFRNTAGSAWGTNVVSSQTLLAGTWYHLVATLDSTSNTALIYINGVQKGSSAISGGWSWGSNTVSFGGRFGGWGGGQYFHGTLDDLRIYNRALTPAEVRQLYNYAPGPVAYYKFDEGAGGSVTDSSGNSNTGTWSGESPRWAAGKIGRAGSFKTATSQVTLTANPLANAGPNPFTISFWLKLDSLAPASVYRAFIENRNLGTNDSGYSIFLDGYSSSKIVLKIGDGSGSNSLSSATAPATGVWQHITYVRNADGMYLYINGILNNSTANGGTRNISTAAIPTIGKYSSTVPFDGLMDEVKIYNYARTPDQIMEDMQGRAGPVSVNAVSVAGKGTVGYWKFDEGSGTTAKDGSENGNNGTITGAVWNQNGKYGKALQFDGVNDYMSATNVQVNATAGEYNTVSFWMRWNGTTPTVPFYMNDGVGYYGFYAPNGTCMGFNTGQGDTYGFNPTGLSGVWTHVVLVFYNGAYTGNSKIYINGINKTLTQCGGSSRSGTARTTIYLGQLGNSSNYFSGLLDEVKIYNYALTSDEVLTEYNHGSALQLGSLSDTSGLTGGSVASNSASAQYCIPGDTTSCAPPVAEWNFDEGQGGTVADSSGNGNTGTWYGGGNHWVAGRQGKAGGFNGSNDYVGSTLVSNLYTIEMWIKLNSDVTGTTVGTGIARHGINNLQNTITLGSVTGTIDGETLTILHESGGYQRTAITDTIPAGWRHVVFVWNAASTKYDIHIDGVRKTTTHGSATDTQLLTSTRFDMGGNTGYASFNGSIDSVRIFNYARTPAQIAWDYNFGEPVARWDFDECGGTAIHDLSGNGNHGTLTGATAGTCDDGTGTTAWSGGKVGKFNSSLKFDGSDDYVNQPTSISNVGSVGFWVYPTSATQSFLQLASGVSVSAASGTVSATGWTGPTIYVNGKANGTVTASSWNHIVVTTGTGITANAIKLGLAGSTYYSGQLDDVQIFNYALTAVQVKQLYNQNAGIRFGPSTGSP